MTVSAVEGFQYLKWQQQLDPPYYVNSTAISADGKVVVAGTFFHNYGGGTPVAQADQFGTFCFDNYGNQLWADKFVGYEGVYWVAVSADGTTAASGGCITQTPFQGYVRAYDVANGPANILDARLPARVNELALSANGDTLVVAADKVYLFTRTDGVFSTTPATYALSGTDNNAQSISVSADGCLFVVGDYLGNFYFFQNDGGSIKLLGEWNDPSLKTIHSVTISADGNWMATCGSDSVVYLFSQTSMTQPTPGISGSYLMDTGGRAGCVALSGNGGFISAVSNQGESGAVYCLQNNTGVPAFLWKQPTPRNPNSTSMDAQANYVTVADGYPDGKPGDFILFDRASGDQLWTYQTLNMNWPMFISADASGIVAGSDHGDVFYFTPQ